MAGVQLNRWQPAGPVQAYKTYGLAMPVETHRRRASCAEVNCPHYLHGWATTVAAGSDDEALIRRAGRHFTIPERLEGGFVRFTFPPGQPCFRAASHTISLEREPFYGVRDGDWRGNPTGRRRRHANGADWTDDFMTHVDRVWGDRR